MAEASIRIRRELQSFPHVDLGREGLDRLEDPEANLVVEQAFVLEAFARAEPISTSSTRAPSAASTLRSSACAQTAPKAPVLAPTTATGLFRSTFVATGREIQSIAFFSWPGIEELYSGVEKSTASASATTRGARRSAGRSSASSSSS